MIKKIIGKLHLWLGLASGLVVFILGITGSIYVFEQELRPLIHDYYFVDKVEEEMLPLSQLLIIANDAAKDYTNKKADRIKFNKEKDRTAVVSYFESDKTTSIWYWDESKRINIYINPYNGKVVKIENQNFEFFGFVFIMHTSLLLKSEIGQLITGVATLIFVVMLISGLILWWPKRRKKAIKQRLWFQWKNNTGWKRKNFDIHNIFGFYALIFALLIAFTGLVWSFAWFNNSVQWIANGGKTMENSSLFIQSDTTNTALLQPIEKVDMFIKTVHANVESYFIRFPKDEQDVFYSYVDYPGKASDCRLYFDQYTGEQIAYLSWENQNNGEKIRSLNYDIHVGSILEIPGKILAFCVSLIAASLPVTGFMIWLGRRRKSPSLGRAGKMTNNK